MKEINVFETQLVNGGNVMADISSSLVNGLSSSEKSFLITGFAGGLGVGGLVGFKFSLVCAAVGLGTYVAYQWYNKPQSQEAN